MSRRPMNGRRIILALLAIAAYVAVWWFASIGINHYFGVTGQIIAIPIEAAGGWLIGRPLGRWAAR